MSMDVPALEESADMGEMPDAMTAACGALDSLQGDEEMTAAMAEAGGFSGLFEENGDVTITAGSVSRTVPAAVAMGESESEEPSEDEAA